jgi:hypothetical protein
MRAGTNAMYVLTRYQPVGWPVFGILSCEVRTTRTFLAIVQEADLVS